jgi:hypothetical protein
MLKKIIAIFDFFIPLSHNKYNEIPININKVVQTGAKTQFGGLKNGLFRVEYHVWIEEDVKIEPTAPANRQIITEIISFGILLNFILHFIHLLACPSSINN